MQKGKTCPFCAKLKKISFAVLFRLWKIHRTFKKAKKGTPFRTFL